MLRTKWTSLIIMLFCICTISLTGCTTSSDGKITSENPLIIDMSEEQNDKQSSTYTPPPSPSQSTTPSPLSSAESFKASCTSISYDILARNTELYIGESVYFRGQIIQVMELGSTYYAFRIAVTQTDYDWWDSGDVVWVNYSGTRMLEEDVVDFWGTVEGRISYTAVLGNEIVIPEITAVYLELVTSGTSSEAVSEPVEEEEETDLSASFEITDWEQEYNDYFEEWSDYVYVYYEVENTGNVEIDYYEVYFTVECKGGKEYYDWSNGSGVKVGKKLSGDTMISVAGREVRSVEIDDWDLTHY